MRMTDSAACEVAAAALAATSGNPSAALSQLVRRALRGNAIN